MRKFVAAALSSILLACVPASVDPHAQTLAAGTTPLKGEQLRRLLNETNTYLMSVRMGDIVVDHPTYELLRRNGTYHRGTGRTGLEGTYAVEGDLLCVVGSGIPRQCRSVLPQHGTIYFLVDISDNSQVLVDLSQRK